IQQFTLGNDGGARKSFNIRNNILYKGKASVSKGKFSFSFIMPKDIGYTYGPGKLSFYAADSVSDASGSFTNFLIGGSYQSASPDNKGPLVEVFMNNPNFKSGGITDDDPILFVRVFDESGINTSGNGIGHDITAYFDNDLQHIHILNDYYLADTDSYKSGIIAYPLSGLGEGLHTVKVKLWDIHNNSGEGYTQFVVIKNNELVIDRLINFPNPFSESTFFSFEHNMSGNPLEVTIEIYNLAGELVRTIKARDEGDGFRSQPLFWDGRNESGNFNRQGLYIYQIRIVNSDGKSAVKSGKLIISR
ncbi:MAG: oxidoreductase, partial [Ignavibacteria bacterium]|nr:oxidoreductase [Ignavibacteria bacterium]